MILLYFFYISTSTMWILKKLLLKIIPLWLIYFNSDQNQFLFTKVPITFYKTKNIYLKKAELTYTIV